MRCLDLTLSTPAENLAGDEALLAWCEEGMHAPILRFWEPKEHFVVLGYANRVSQEIRADLGCDSLPGIYRRCSGGGSVVQGPGCLNYALILKAEAGGALGGIASANRFIMEKHREVLQNLLNESERRGPRRVTVEGHTDLAVDGLKCSGNAQRRARNWLLFHGTFLLHLDLREIERLLMQPARQPPYRNQRTHREFLVNLELPAEHLKQALRHAWSALEPMADWPREETQRLARDKYETNAWNLKF
jgi:lipoate-protein ligase A